MSEKDENATWIEKFWQQNEKLQSFKDVEDPGFEFILKVELLMEDQGITRVELAERMRRTPAYVTQVLSEGRNLTMKTMVTIARALGSKVIIDLVAD